jgi:formylmethanofuran dehydrogenase subunit E
MADDRDKLWRESVKFHGHSCPALAIGVRVALDYREEMGLTSRAEDEEIVAIVETDACGVDGIQVILGCTAGKGNLWLRRRGKHVFSIYQRSTGHGLRYCWKSYGLDGLNREDRTESFLKAPKGELYAVEPARYPLPPEASIYSSVFCASCGERTAEPCLRVRDGQMICLDCAGEPFDFSRRLIL